MALDARSWLMLVGSAAILAACSDATSPKSPTTPDVASLLSEMSASGLGAAASFASPEAGAVQSAMPSPTPANCAFDASTGFFECPTVTVNGLTITRAFRLIDAAGNSQSQASGQTVAIETKSTVKGTVTFDVRGSASGTIAVDRSDDMTLSGIRTNKHTLNGQGASHLDNQITTSFGPLHTLLDATETTSNVVLPDAKSGQRWPQSGSIVYHQTTTENPETPGAITFKTTVVVTFTGSSRVTITVTTDFGTQSCQYDLSQRSTVGVCFVAVA